MEEAVECLKNDRVKKNLELIPAKECRDILANLLTEEAEKRWTAKRVLQLSGFKGEANYAED